VRVEVRDVEQQRRRVKIGHQRHRRGLSLVQENHSLEKDIRCAPDSGQAFRDQCRESSAFSLRVLHPPLLKLMCDRVLVSRNFGLTSAVAPCHRNRVNRNHLRKFASVPLKKLEVACLGSADLVSVSVENRNLLASLGSQGKNRNPLACLRNAGSYDKVSYCIKVLVARRSRQEPSKANLGYELYDGSVITVKGFSEGGRDFGRDK